MIATRDKAHREGRSNERWIMLFQFGAISFSALATLLGILAKWRWLNDRVAIEPWMIGLLAAVSTGLQALPSKTVWRQKADTWYAHRDTTDSLIARLKYEMGEQGHKEQIARASKDFGSARADFGKRMHEINAQHSGASNAVRRGSDEH